MPVEYATRGHQPPDGRILFLKKKTNVMVLLLFFYIIYAVSITIQTTARLTAVLLGFTKMEKFASLLQMQRETLLTSLISIIRVYEKSMLIAMTNLMLLSILHNHDSILQVIAINVALIATLAATTCSRRLDVSSAQSMRDVIVRRRGDRHFAVLRLAIYALIGIGMAMDVFMLIIAIVHCAIEHLISTITRNVSPRSGDRDGAVVVLGILERKARCGTT